MVINESAIVGLERVVIADFQGQHGSDVSHFLVADLLASGLTILDRSTIDMLVTENRLTSSEIGDQATAVKVGKLLGAQAVIFGHIKEAQNVGITKFRITGDIRMLDVERGSVAAALNVTHVHDADPLFALECILLSPVEVLRAVFAPQDRSVYTNLEESRKQKAVEEATLAVRGFSKEVGRAFNGALRKFREKELLRTDLLRRLDGSLAASDYNSSAQSLADLKKLVPDCRDLGLLQRRVDALGIAHQVDIAVQNNNKLEAERRLDELRRFMPDYEGLKDIEKRVGEMSLREGVKTDSRSEKAETNQERVISREPVVK
jgi:hypothetical protein